MIIELLKRKYPYIKVNAKVTDISVDKSFESYEIYRICTPIERERGFSSSYEPSELLFGSYRERGFSSSYEPSELLFGSYSDYSNCIYDNPYLTESKPDYYKDRHGDIYRKVKCYNCMLKLKYNIMGKYIENTIHHTLSTPIDGVFGFFDSFHPPKVLVIGVNRNNYLDIIKDLELSGKVLPSWIETYIMRKKERK